MVHKSFLLKHGIILDYQRHALKNFVEPSRKGTARGDKIGFPKHKYICCLVVGITNFKPKFIADTYGKRYGFSYGLLRKWKTESDFIAEAEQHREDFIRYMMKIVLDAAETKATAWDDYMELGAELTEDEFLILEAIRDKDLKIFHPDIVDKLQREMRILFDEALQLITDNGGLIYEKNFAMKYSLARSLGILIGMYRGEEPPDTTLIEAVVAISAFRSITNFAKRMEMTDKEKRFFDISREYVEGFFDSLMREKRKAFSGE